MSVPEIQAEELKYRLDQGESLLLLDVRDEYEYELSNIGGHLILPELPKRFHELAVDQEIVAMPPCRQLRPRKHISELSAD